MDHDWYCFTRELEKNRQSIRRTVDRDKIQALQTVNSEQEYKEMCRSIKNYLHSYRDANISDKAFIECLVSVHGAMCNKESEKEKNAHNAVVLRFMIKTHLSYKGVAKKLHVSRDTVCNYINECTRDMAILNYGFMAVWNPQKDRLKYIFQNYQLIKAYMEIDENPFSDIVKQKRELYRNATIKAVEGITVILEYYKSYIAFSDENNREYNERALYIIRQLYIDDKKELEQVAYDLGVSIDTIYSEINKFFTRAKELCELI